MPYFNLAKPMEGWLNGMHFDKVMQITDTDEGEIIRYFRMAIQILREIKDAPISRNSATASPIPSASSTAASIDAEKQLREG